jgi:GNAT superfamily N-acetyltransferase
MTPPRPSDPPPARDDYFVSDSPELIDVDFACAALAGSYWAQNRPRAVVEESIRGSLCFGVYGKPGGRQVGLARVVTDGATFSWLCDVVIDPGHRGRGLGKFLVASVLSHPRLRGTMFLLGTRDAHGLYERFGFIRSEMMRCLPPDRMQSPPDAPTPAAPGGAGAGNTPETGLT